MLYELSSPPWGDDGNSPTWEICPCCGTEFGYEDSTPASAREMRSRWIAGGKQWLDKREKSADWDFGIQSKHIPEGYL
ncbi:hypothetical protein F7R19_10270 [Cupriavidus pauculus]|nr:hypothetical protein F7R19_10270 [Cupriavidus pauculus]